MKNVKILTLKDMSRACELYEVVLLIEPRDGGWLVVSNLNYHFDIRRNLHIDEHNYCTHDVKDTELNKIFYDIIKEMSSKNCNKLTKILNTYLVKLIPEHLI